MAVRARGVAIRPERPDDRAAIRALVYAAFLDHPQSEPGAAPTEHLIVDGLRAAGALTISLVAEEGGRIVGHIAFSPVRVDGLSGGWFGLGPVAVEQSRRGAGIGSALIRRGLEELRSLGAAGAVLVGEPGYYGRFGFAARPGLTFPGVPHEYLLALPFAGAVPVGVVAYEPAFSVA